MNCRMALIAGIAGLLGVVGAASCSRHGGHQRAGHAQDLGYLRVVSLSPSEDAHHTLKMRDSASQVWYVDPRPGLDLSDLVHDDAFVDVPQEDPNDVGIVLRLSGLDKRLRFQDWLRSRAGSSIGVIVDQHITMVFVATAGDYLHVRVAGFANRDAAESCLKTIRRAGGAPAPG